MPARGMAPRVAFLYPRDMKFVVYLSVAFWVVLTVVSSIDIDATAKLVSELHLG